MRNVLFAGNPITLSGNEIKIGDIAPDFTAVSQSLAPFEFYKQTEGKVVIISSVPSLDTGVCEFQTTHFNHEVSNLSDDVYLVTVSVDLPFAQKRFCSTHGIENSAVVSDHRNLDFGNKYGFILEEVRLLERGVVIVDKERKIRYVEYLQEVTNHPNYEAALEAVKALI